jgi:FkbM family methyltransferase
MNNDSAPNIQLSYFGKMAFKCYDIARDWGLMGLPGVQTIANTVYDIVRPHGALSVNVEGSTIHLKPEDRTITPLLIANGSYEESETETCKKFIKPGMTVIDIGANIGYFSCLFARLVGSGGKVISFEPEPDNFKWLNKNIQENHYSCIEANNLALADKEGSLDLYVGEVSQTTSSFIEDNIVYENHVDKVPVKTAKLDDFLEQQAVDSVDFIKIDVQGFEETVFRGAQKTLSSAHISMIMEFWPYGLKKAGTNVDQLLSTLEGFNFSIYKLDEKNADLHKTSREEIMSSIDYDDRHYLNLFLTKDNLA